MPLQFLLEFDPSACNFKLTLFRSFNFPLQYRPLVWRNTHPYCVVDRHEDITHPNKIAEDPTCDRSVTFYGYVRGTHLKPGTKMHLIGAGDFSMTELSVMPDPCPLPDKDKKNQNLSKKESLLYAPLSNVGAVSFDKDAVYIDIGRVNYTKKENLAIADKEADEAPSDSDSDSDDDEDDGAPASMLKNLQDVRAGVDEKMKQSSLRIFKSSKAVNAESDGSDSDSDASDDDQAPSRMSQSAIEELARPFRSRTLANEESDSENDNSDDEEEDSDDDDEELDSDAEEVDNDDYDDDDSDASGMEDDEEAEKGDDSNGNTKPASASALWKTDLAQRAAEAYIGRELTHVNLQELIYGTSRSVVVSEEEVQAPEEGDDENDDDSDDEFFKIRKPNAEKQQVGSASRSGTQSDVQLLGEEDSSRTVDGERNEFDVAVWLEEGGDCLLESIRDQFVTGNWDAKKGGGDDDDDEAFGDFEDLETGAKFGPNGEIDSDNDDDEMDTEGMTDEQIREHNGQKKANKKSAFDDEYDGDKQVAGVAKGTNEEQAETEYVDSLRRAKEARLKRNKDEFGEDGEASRIRHEGFRQGLYCRIRIDGVPCEFVDTFNPVLPLVLGGLTPQETNHGFIRCRFKKHRWHRRTLKCNDPLIFSVGWRRFQSMPVFSTEDQNGRHRYVVQCHHLCLPLFVLNII